MSRLIVFGILIILIAISITVIVTYISKDNASDDVYLQQMKNLKYDSDFDTVVAYHSLD